MTVLRRGYVPVEPDINGFDDKLRDKLRRQDPGGKAGKQIGGQLNRALKRLDLDPIDVKADPKLAFAAIELTERRLQALSGDAATVEVKVRTERALSELSRFRKQLGDVGGGAGPEAAQEFSLSFVQRLGPLLAKMPITGPVGAAVAGAGAAAAPLLGAMISGAVIGGVGIGGVTGGLVVASKDARVKAAIEDLGDSLKTRLQDASVAFIEPAIRGLGVIEAALDGIDIEGIFADASRMVAPLADDIASALHALGMGIRDVIANAGPVVDQIGSGIQQIGIALGSGLALLADNGEEAADALGLMFDLISGSITTIFTLVDGLSTVYRWMERLGAIGTVKDMLDKTGESARKTGSGYFGLAQNLQYTVDETTRLKEAQEKLKPYQDALKTSQDGLQFTLDRLSGKFSVATLAANAMQSAIDGLSSAAIRQTDTNEEYEASWDNLSDAVKANKSSLDAHTQAGRANRDALQGLLAKSRDMYVADINAGVAVDEARKKHEKRTGAIEKEAAKLGLNRAETQKLIGTYGKIPAKKETDLILDGVAQVADALLDLAAIQLHLAKGTKLPPDLARRLARAQYGMPDTKRAFGGPLPGHAPHDRADNMVYAGTPGEWVIQRPSVRRMERENPGALEHINRTGRLPAYASGGLLRASRTNVADYATFVTTAGMTKIPSLQAVIAAVPVMMGNPGDWPSSPSAQRGDSGVWRAIVRMIRATGPLSGSFGNAYRRGDPLWHGSGRAVDWMGYNQDALASYLAARRPLELIHRTRNRDYAYTRGVNKGSFNNALMEAHRNHIHIAMDDGGWRILQPGLNIIPNGTGGPEPIAGPKAMAQMAPTYNLTFNVAPGAHPAEIGRQVVSQIQAFERANGKRWRQ